MISETLNASWRALSFSAFVLREIMDNPLADETASARLKQVGLMSVLYHMHVANEPMTLAAIGDVTGLTRGGIYETVAFLLERKLLSETETPNAKGRGKARRFVIPEAVFERIRRVEQPSS